jgi:hypothetical protein
VVKPTRVSTWSVPGRVWLSGKAAQDREWEGARKRFAKDMAEKGLDLIGEPTESTEYDEQHRHVILHIEAEARPMMNVFIAPIDADPNDRASWTPIGWTDSVTFRPRGT